jgi:DNA-binding HxlR family transcriptional regulator
MATKSAAQRRAEAKIVYDAFMATCPTRQVMATVGDKWAGLLLNAMADGPRRHGQLRVTVAGISQKMLTQTLRTLERDGLVVRTVEASVPVTVTYGLTELGATLMPILRALKTWSESHIGEIMDARDSYDGAMATAS